MIKKNISEMTAREFIEDTEQYYAEREARNNKEMTVDETVKAIQQSIVRLGYGSILTEEEKIEMREKREKAGRRREFFAKISEFLRSVFFPPLSIAFHAISFVTKGIGIISSFGLFAGFYYAYKSVVALMDGVPFKDVDTNGKAITFILLPFIAYGISVITERIYCYFEDNSF